MAVTLTFGNLPPNPETVIKGEQIDTRVFAEAIKMQNEQWAGTGLNLGGIAYTTTLTTTSTIYGGGGGHDFLITNYQPSFKVKMRNNNTDQAIFYMRAYGRNCNVRVRVFNMAGTQLQINTAIASSNNFGWVGVNFALTGLNANDERFIVIDIARNTFSASAELAQVACIIRPSGASQLPNQ